MPALGHGPRPPLSAILPSAEKGYSQKSKYRNPFGEGAGIVPRAQTERQGDAAPAACL